MLEMSKDPAAFRAYIDEQGVKGYLMLMVAMFLQVVAAVIPGGPFEIAAGYAFGVWKGALIADVAMTLGSLFVFLMVRKFGTKFACLFVSKKKLDSVKFFHSLFKKGPAGVHLLPDTRVPRRTSSHTSWALPT